MRFELNEYQAVVATALDQIAAPFRAPPMLHGEFSIYGNVLDAELDRSGFLDVVADGELADVMGALLVYEMSRLPYCVEVAASTLVRPAVCPEAPRPLALVEHVDRPARFLPQAKAALILRDDSVALLTIEPGDVSLVPSLFAYPFGVLGTGVTDRAVAIDADPKLVRRLWRIGLASEIAGSIDAALAFTTDYVKQRQQFGQPIGSFQALQHRLAEVAVLNEATHWLALGAASSGGDIDAALACAYAQKSAAQAAHDLQQFNGAMGLTLEHPLHLWTYRLKALVSELGGAGAQALDAADRHWGPAA